MSAKKPDNVVFNEEKEQYDAFLKPYATNLGAPSIRVTDTAAWKNTNVHKVNAQFKAKYEELKLEYDALMVKFEFNNMMYSAKFNFEPVVGELYHLYRDKNLNPFLSLIAPHECNFDYIASSRLTADKLWEEVKL